MINIFKAIKTRKRVIDNIRMYESLRFRLNYNQSFENNIEVKIHILDNIEKVDSKIELLKSLL